jgi:predicted MFS family arabinose efflux permease
MWASLGTAAVGLPLLLVGRLEFVLAGMVLAAVGLFLAQAVATGFVGRVAQDRAAGSGLYLACYFLGGLAGTACLGQVFDRYGWAACVGGVALALALAGGLAALLVPPKEPAVATM